MIKEIKIPSPGESVTEVEIGRWLVTDGSQVTKGQEIAEVESDKATLTLIADVSGKLTIMAKEGETIPVGSVAAVINTGIIESLPEPEPEPEPLPSPEPSPELPPVPETHSRDSGSLKISAIAREMMKEHQLSVVELVSGLKRVGKKEVEEVLALRQKEEYPVDRPDSFSREVVKERMSMLRRKLSERLVSVKNETAMLTTFNEVDMSAVLELRTRYQQEFTDKHGLKLGFMAFFTKAAAIAVQSHPSVNSMIDGEDIISPRYVDVGIAVQTPKGLMVPVVRNAESKSIPRIETEIRDLAEKARDKKISLEELSGGTFTITNGGVFGSLLSTPILNPPQSAILGMHNIVERPAAVLGKVEIRPMMYIALSYDHRVIDGKDAVGFLVKVKEMIENPVRMGSEGRDPIEILLGI